MKLFDYWRSSAAYRVRIALNLKGLTAEHLPVHLRRSEQRGERYRGTNPAGLVPALETDEGQVLTQSLAIVEWLEEVHPLPRLLPVDPALRAQVRAAALTIACEIHPLNNLRVLDYLEHTLSLDQAARSAWYKHWIAEGLTALEAQLALQPAGGPYAFGEAPGLADLCLVPQLANARRFDCPLVAFPTLTAIDAACTLLPAFRQARPENQADAE